MRVKGNLQPSAAFTLEDQPKMPGYVLARFYENASPYTETRDGEATSGYEYDEYHLELLKTAELEQEIEAQYETYLKQAKLNEIQRHPFDALDYRQNVEANERNAANIDYLSMMMDVELPGGEENAQQEI